MSLLKTVKLNRLMIVNVRSSNEDEIRHVYSPASSSETSDKIKDQVHAYLKNNKNIEINISSCNIISEKLNTYVCSSINRVRSPLVISSSVLVINKRPVGP